MKLILLGPPASGKGTISSKLIKDFKLQHISAGELLREEVKKKTTIGKAIKNTIENGDLVPDHLVIELVRLIVKKRFILDGFPRTLHQAKDIKDLKINKVIYLKLTENQAVERISGRRVCKKGHIYHTKYIKPKKVGICDIDKTKLIQRKDDNEKVVRERFKVYNKRTKPLINFYKKEGILLTIDASPLPKEVYVSVKKILNT